MTQVLSASRCGRVSSVGRDDDRGRELQRYGGSGCFGARPPWHRRTRGVRPRSRASRRRSPAHRRAGAGEERPDALAGWEALELATLGAARALHLEDEIGSLGSGKRADLTVVSLAGSPYLPWEDPAAAVVFGGSPDRVLLTLVDGEERYRKGGFGWHELRRSASAARARLLHRKATRPSAEPVAPRT